MKYFAPTLIALFLLSGCSYYAKQAEFIPRQNDKWVQFGDLEAVSFSCEKTKLIAVPTVLSKQKKAYSFCLIPFAPAGNNQKPTNYKNTDWPVTLTLRIENTPNEKQCNLNPKIKIKNSGTYIEPLEHYTDPISSFDTGGEYYECKFRFPRSKALFTGFTLYFEPSNSKCEIEPLEYMFTEGLEHTTVPLQ